MKEVVKNVLFMLVCLACGVLFFWSVTSSSRTSRQTDIDAINPAEPKAEPQALTRTALYRGPIDPVTHGPPGWAPVPPCCQVPLPNSARAERIPAPTAQTRCVSPCFDCACECEMGSPCDCIGRK